MAEVLDPEEIKKDIEDIADIAVIADSKGGKKLVDSLTEDVIGTLNKLCESFGSIPEKEMVSSLAFIKSNLDLIRAISRAKSNKKYLEELLAEALQK